MFGQLVVVQEQCRVHLDVGFENAVTMKILEIPQLP